MSKLKRFFMSLLGPSRRSVKREIEDRAFLEEIKQEQRERERIRARIRAIEATLPIQYREQRGR